MVDKQELTYELLSDSDVALAQAFGLVFRVDDPTVAPGPARHLPPHPVGVSATLAPSDGRNDCLDVT